MNLSQAVEIFLIARTAEGYSPHTLEYYRLYLSRLTEFLDNPDLREIQPIDLNRFMAWLRTDYTPNRTNGDTSPLRPVTLKGHWAVIRSFFGWANQEWGIPRPDANLAAPRHIAPVVEPFTRDEIIALLDNVEYTQPAATNGRKPFRMRRPTGRRDKALLLLLLDTGIRAGECARLKVGDVRLPSPSDKPPYMGEITIHPYGSGRKSRPRVVYITPATIKALMLYQAEDRPPDLHPDDPLFTTTEGKPLGRNALRLMLRKTGDRAGVPNTHPHRFRHTFAIEFLRNGGNPFMLQRLMGHGSLEMTSRYLNIVQADLSKAQKSASPVARWQL